METATPSPGQSSGGRSLRRLRLQDALLLPFALLLVLGGMALRGGARVLRRARIVRATEVVLARLPPWAILPLFLIPEAMSHIGGFYAAYLLAHRHFLAATVVVVLIKGVGLLIALWIYQACRPALMTIAWFAWSHGKVEAARAWAVAAGRGVVPGAGKPPGAAHAGRRFSAIRLRIRRVLLRLR
ncbi:hypothetical protein [Acidisoma cladoniae]|jgi:hypothetical protein|uniref:hypothetical protein n=1 Tax=Acidisoma cladoniae TaxID=3040935 RepID=UPI00254D58B9|nr:hypothetical protein [Acidisoma sp. PAMC 29798]